MSTIAELGLRIESEEAARAAENLDRLVASGAKAEQAAEKTGDAWEEARRQFRDTTTSVDDQRASLEKLLGQIDPTVAAYARLDDMQQRLSTFKGAGLDAETFNSYQAKINQARAAIGEVDNDLNQVGMTSRATAAALRGVPAQFTDIFTSLVAGQPPLMVFLQQGGQLKDMFGGIGPAAKALGGYVLGLVNPFTVAAAAVGALTLAYYQGSQEADAYQLSLESTGNAAGATGDQLAATAQRIGDTIGTTGKAAEVLAQLAATGKIAVAQFEDLATAAIAWEKAGGQAAAVTVAEFAKLADDPVKAVLALNEKYNFLTASVFEQIYALQEQGNAQAAATVAEEAYASALNERAGRIEQNLGAIEKAWGGIVGAAKEAWDAMLDVGREDTLEERISFIDTRLKQIAEGGGVGLFQNQQDIVNSLREQRDMLVSQKEAEADLATYTAERARKEREGADAYRDVQNALDATASKQDKLQKALLENERDIAKARAAGYQISKEQEALLEKQIRDKFKERGTGRASVDLSGVGDAKNRLAAVVSEYKGYAKELDAAQTAGLITQEQFASQRVALLQQEAAEVENAYQREISALEKARDRSTTTAQQRIQLDQRIAKAHSDMAMAQRESDSELAVLATNEQGRLEKQAQAVTSYTDALERQVRTQREQGLRAAAGVGLGDRDRAIAGEMNSIEDRANQLRYDLERDKADKARNMSADEYRMKLDAINRTEVQLKETVVANYEDMDRAQSSWSAGARSAFDNYLDSARDVAGQTRDLFTSAFGSMEDAIVEFAMTGKLSFSDFAKSILADMARIAARQASSQILSALVGAATSYFTGSSSMSAGSTQAGYTGTDYSTWVSGQRASGGPVESNSLYEVNELGPELLSQNGRTYLMTGSQGGSITPLGRSTVPAVSGGSSVAPQVNITINSDGSSDVSGDADMAKTLGPQIVTLIQGEIAKNERRTLSPGGNTWKAMNGRA